MPALRQVAFLVLCLSATNVLAIPLIEAPHPRIARSTTRLDARQQEISEPVSFQRVTTSQSTVGTVTETCQVTLTPIDGDTVRQDKSCTYVVTPIGGTPPPPPPPDDNPNGDQDDPNGDQDDNPDNNQDPPPPPPADDETAGQGGETGSVEDPTATTTTDDAVFTTIASDLDVRPPVAAPTGGGATDAPPGNGGTGDAGGDTGGDAPPTSEVGTDSVPVTQTAGQSPPETEPTAEEAQGEVPGRRLEVLPIGLGVFAGISVIALIVVGLVTYERTKYRKAFRQRKLAEAGAAMGYSGMSERT